MEEEIKKLQEKIAQLEVQNALLQKQIENKNTTSLNNVNNFSYTTDKQDDKAHFSHYPLQPLPPVEHLSNDQISRYARHLLLPDFGVKGQLAISGKSVLVIGAGGLGCPVALYLATSGIARIGIIDYDVVEESNLHRQVVHPEANVGVSKSLSIKQEALRRNSKLECIAYDGILSADNALDIIKGYDVIVDASDNVPTRYLVNDACVVLGKPLVSGSALKWEGQVSVYNFKNGPCYRCLFPKPPDPNTVTRCSDGGVIGAVTGIIGCIQALEAIKVLSGCGDTLHGKLLFFDGTTSVFRTVKLRPKQKECAVCGETPSITNKLIDYPVFCGSPYSDKAEKAENTIPASHVVTCKEYNNILLDKHHLLLDVRESVQFDICALPNSLNIPLDKLQRELEAVKQKLEATPDLPVYVVCRRGWDSQTAVEILLQNGINNVYHIDGGLLNWAETVDPNFPIY